MNRCVFLGKEDTFLILEEEEERLNEAMKIVAEEYKELEENRMEYFTKLYREPLGIPMDATISEEREFILKRFGERPIESDEFKDIMREAQETYEEEKKVVDWRNRFEEMGFETLDVTHLIEVRNG